MTKQVREHDFPDKRMVLDAYTHDLEKLVKVAGLSPEFDTACRANLDLNLNWAVVKDWKAASRYEVGITAAQAKDLLSACTSRKNGVLTWIKSKW